MPRPNPHWSVCAVSLSIACGGGTVTTEGAPGFGAVMAGYWVDGHTADIVWIQSDELGEVEKDSLASNASISLSTVADDCAKTQAYLDAWAAASKDLMDAKDYCSAVADFYVAQAQAYKDTTVAGSSTLYAGWCWDDNCDDQKMKEGEIAIQKEGEDTLAWATISIGVEPRDPEDARDIWDTDACTWNTDYTYPDDTDTWVITNGSVEVENFDDHTAGGTVSGDLVEFQKYSEDPASKSTGSVDATFSAIECDLDYPSVVVL